MLIVKSLHEYLRASKNTNKKVLDFSPNSLPELANRTGNTDFSQEIYSFIISVCSYLLHCRFNYIEINSDHSLVTSVFPILL